MLRILYSLILSFTLFSLAFIISDGFGDAECTLNTWMGAFLLPMWSVGIISLWHDLGRYAYENFFESKESSMSLNPFFTHLERSSLSCIKSKIFSFNSSTSPHFASSPVT